MLRVPEDASPLPYSMPIELLSAVPIRCRNRIIRTEVPRSHEAYDVLSDSQRGQEHDDDLAGSRTYSHVPPEPLILETPTYVVFRPSALGIDEKIVRVFSDDGRHGRAVSVSHAEHRPRIKEFETHTVLAWYWARWVFSSPRSFYAVWRRREPAADWAHRFMSS